MSSCKLIQRAAIRAVLAACLLLVGAALAWAQHDMQNMPGMDMGGKSKSKAKSNSRSTAANRKRAQKRGGTAAMKGMNMPSSSRASSRSKTAPVRKMNMPGMDMSEKAPAAQQGASPEQMNMPRMNMPSSTAAPQASPSASPESMDMSMPGMQMPASSQQPSTSASPKPAASPQTEMNMPGMNVPAQSPSAQPAMSPGQMNMPGMQNRQNPAPPAGNQTNPHATHNMGGMGNMNMGSANEKGQPAGGMAGMNTPGMSMPGMVMESDGRITSRSGSGTMWQPASTPMHMLHWQKGDWMIMLHGEGKLGVNAQGGPRGVTKFESQNWLMAMASRRVGRGTLDLRSMFSLEPFSFSPGGSPELFQTGETFRGQPLRDKQHPHDLFMTLSASYTLPIGEHGSWFGYFGFPGEPALGPVAFMHRASAAENPSAPLAHHLEDSTHISFGVFTTGFTYRKFKLEGSLFNGREPDENRYNFELNPWNSRSVRLQFAPNRNWAMQVSYGLLKNPEALEPGDVRRTTASVSYNKQLARGNWATTLIWGRNREGHHGEPSTLNGYTAESTLQFLNRNYLYTRLELVDKPGLLDAADRQRLGITDNHPIFRIGAYTFGAAHDIWETDKFTVALGGDVTFYSKPPVLDAIYGSNPTSYHFFVRFRLGRMSVGGRNMAKTPSRSNTASMDMQK